MKYLIRGSAMVVWWIVFIFAIYVAIPVLENFNFFGIFEYIGIGILAGIWGIGNDYILRFLKRTERKVF